MVRDWFPNADIKVVEAPARGYQEVISGRADVFITSNIEGATLTEKFPQIRRMEVDAPARPTPIAMILPQAGQVWINYVNNWIKLKQEKGFFAATAAKWAFSKKRIKSALRNGGFGLRFSCTHQLDPKST
ncbi:hypothetical protein AKJ29_03955 [Aliiroseovarius crassostreae]|uniref:Uncharacterized protein n=2 Tax=Aliiroseovarius crassostreae TaxID=154981 RepID=A0A0P7ICS7_9RHOB|nr:hypothetical protein AKJ29_03955 [Aliiroseovarius crassostreae]